MNRLTVTAAIMLAATPLTTLASVCTPPNDHSITNWSQCANDPYTGWERHIGYGIFETRVEDAWNYCKRLETFYNVPGQMNLVSIADSDMDTCVNDLLVTISTQAGTDYPATASLGAQYYNSTDLWAWADGVNVMKTAKDYNSCTSVDANGICQPKDGQKCLIATIDPNNGYYWDTYSCLDSHVNFMCEYSCNPAGPDVPDDGNWPPADCWWCDGDRPGFMQEMVGFIGNVTSDPTIYIQEQDMTINQLDLPKKSDGSNPIFPYIAYNPNVGAFEVVGSFNQDTLTAPNGNGNGSYHFNVDFQNHQTQVKNSNYDGRSFSSFTYVPDVKGTVFVGGYPPNVDNDYQYERVMSRPMIYATTDANNRYTLPTSWPSNYHCNNSPGTCKILSFPTTSYHSEKLFVVGGSSYAYCPSPSLGATGYIWSLYFDPAQMNTGNELQWQTYTSLTSDYGTCRGVMSFTAIQNTLLTTTLNYVDTVTSYTGFEAINYNANISYPAVTSPTAFALGNDMPVQFTTVATSSSNLQSWNVMGGAMRGSTDNLATIYNGAKDQGFQTGTAPLFPSSLVGQQLLGTTLSNQFPAPIYN
jgi:hypothetical protein